MVATRALTLDIKRLRALKEQVDAYLRDPDPTHLANSVIDQGIFNSIGKPVGYTGANFFVGNYQASLALLDVLAPGARVDVASREEATGLLKTKKVKLISVRVSGKAKGEETGFTGSSTSYHASADKAMLSALVNAVLDLTTRQVSLGSDGTVSSNNAPRSKRGGAVVDDAKVQSAGGDDLVKERAASSGRPKTPLLPIGFEPQAMGREAAATTGSLKNPASARLPRAPR